MTVDAQVGAPEHMWRYMQSIGVWCVAYCIVPMIVTKTNWHPVHARVLEGVNSFKNVSGDDLHF